MRRRRLSKVRARKTVLPLALAALILALAVGSLRFYAADSAESMLAASAVGDTTCGDNPRGPADMMCNKETPKQFVYKCAYPKKIQDKKDKDYPAQCMLNKPCQETEKKSGKVIKGHCVKSLCCHADTVDGKPIAGQPKGAPKGSEQPGQGQGGKPPEMPQMPQGGGGSGGGGQPQQQPTASQPCPANVKSTDRPVGADGQPCTPAIGSSVLDNAFSSSPYAGLSTIGSDQNARTLGTLASIAATPDQTNPQTRADASSPAPAQAQPLARTTADGVVQGITSSYTSANLDGSTGAVRSDDTSQTTGFDNGTPAAGGTQERSAWGTVLSTLSQSLGNAIRWLTSL